MEAVLISSCACLEQQAGQHKARYLEDTPRTFFKRLSGLIGKARGNAGLYCFENCSSIHTIGMSYPIDIAFISRRGSVMKVEREVQPWRFVSCKGAYLTLERHASRKPWFIPHQVVDIQCYIEGNTKSWTILKTS